MQCALSSHRSAWRSPWHWIGRRFEDLAPGLARLDPRSPAAGSLRKLIAVELPALVDSWRMVPIAARRVPHADGRTPDDHLINGMQLIESELARASDVLGRGTLDEIAVQGRYLELKYRGDDPLGGRGRRSSRTACAVSSLATIAALA